MVVVDLHAGFPNEHEGDRAGELFAEGQPLAVDDLACGERRGQKGFKGVVAPVFGVAAGGFGRDPDQECGMQNKHDDGNHFFVAHHAHSVLQRGNHPDGKNKHDEQPDAGGAGVLALHGEPEKGIAFQPGAAFYGAGAGTGGIFAAPAARLFGAVLPGVRNMAAGARDHGGGQEQLPEDGKPESGRRKWR